MNTLSQLANFVSDAYRIAPTKPFVPEDIVLGQYSFLPWIRGGIGAVLEPVAGALRGSVTVGIPVQADGRADEIATTTVEVRGPGDVLGLDQAQIIRQYPLPGAIGVEDSFLAHIEFDSPALPWAFSPEAPVGNLLTPWVALVVLQIGRYDIGPGLGGLPDSVNTFQGELQPLDDATIWAHAQLIGPAPTGATDDRLTAEYSSVNLSRLLCPRKLQADTTYLACVVPSYNAGVAVGLAQSPPATLGPAWTRALDGSDADVAITLPVYASWRFSVGDDGDFESLAAKLQGVAAPWEVGRRITEMDNPGGGLPALAVDDSGALQTVHGPLVSPIAPNPASTDPKEQAAVIAEAATWPAAETEALRDLLNAPSVLAGTTATGAVPFPEVGPEIYARYQAAANRLDPGRDGDWFGALNLAPEHRIQAGLGTRVVQRDQEQLMQAAWAQVGEINTTNRILRQAQFARFVATSTFARHLVPLGYGDLLASTRGVQSRVLADPALTVAADIAGSYLASTAASAAFRRLTRPLGPLSRFIAADPAAHQRLVADGAVARDMQRPYQQLDGVNGVSAAAVHALDAATVAAALAIPVAHVVKTLLADGKRLTTEAALPDIAIARVKRHQADPTKYAATAGTALLDHIQAGLAAGGAKQRAWLFAAAGLVQPIALADPSLRAPADKLLSQLAQYGAQGGAAASPVLQQIFAAARETPADELRKGFEVLSEQFVSASWAGTPVRPAPASSSATLLASIEPRVTLTARFRSLIGTTLPSWLPIDWFDDLVLSPVMAAPVFTRPMYEALDAYSRDWLLPGLASFPQPNVVTALVSQPKFVEAFFCGLSHEMGRELLWRGFPTDQRGTYFRRFWDPANDELAQDIARFTQTPLGSHVTADLDDRVVLMVRGELIKRYPNAIVLAMYAGNLDANGIPIFEDPAANPATKVLAAMQFHGHLEPDITLVGFDLTVAEIQSGAVGDAGWWFVIAEHPTAPRFGLAEATTGTSRDVLGWPTMPQRLGFLDGTQTRSVPDTADVGSPSATFGADGASSAHVLLRDPIRAAFAALPMVTRIGTAS